MEPTADATAQARSYPPLAVRLENQWDTMLIRADSTLAGGTESYYRCLDEARLPILAESGQPSDELGMMMSGTAGVGVDIDDIPRSADDPRVQGETWQESLGVEQEVLAADRACRIDVYEQHIGAVGAMVEEFAVDHAAEPAAVGAGWAELARRAGELPDPRRSSSGSGRGGRDHLV